MSLIFDLKGYLLYFKGIKEGCIELYYEILNALMSYLLQCKVSEYDLAVFAANKIISIRINDMELITPPEIDMVCICTYIYTLYIHCIATT